MEESSVPGFEVAYSANNDGQGIQVGEIEITNTRTAFVLPETGGSGTVFFTAAGILLIAAAGLGYWYTRYRRRKRRDASAE